MTATVHAHNEKPSGEAALGSIVITVNTADQVIRDPAGNVVFQGPATIGLVNGEATFTLPASDDETLEPSGFTFTASEQLKHVSKSSYRTVDFQTLDGETIHLADLASGDEVALDPSYGANLNGLTARVIAIEAGGTSGGLPDNLKNKTGTYAALAGDFVRGDTTSAGFTVTLPAGSSIGATVSVQKTDASAHVLTVAPPGGGTINGDANATIVGRWAGAVFEHLGSEVWAVASMFSGVGPAGPAGPTGPVGGSGVQGLFGIGVLGSFYPVAGVPISSSASHALGAAGTAFVGTPFIAPEDITIDALGCYVGTGGASGVIRLGLITPRAANPYRLALGGVYGDLLAEAASTVDASSSGPKTAALSAPLVIPAGHAVAGIMIVQGSAGVSAWSEDNSGLANSPWGNAGGDIEGGPVICATATGFTAGAIPATFTPTAFRAAGLGGSVWMRRSA